MAAAETEPKFKKKQTGISLALSLDSRSFSRFLRHARLKQAAAGRQAEETEPSKAISDSDCACVLLGHQSSHTAQRKRRETDTVHARMLQVQRQGRQTNWKEELLSLRLRGPEHSEILYYKPCMQANGAQTGTVVAIIRPCL